MSTNEISEHEHNAVIKAMQKNVDGIILLPNQQDTQSIELLNKRDFPYIIIGRMFHELEADYVLADDRKGAYLATRHLIEKGHKEILFLNSFSHIYSSVERLEGYKTAHIENNLPFKRKYVKTVSTLMGNTEKELKRIFNKPNNYSAIFCYCDIIAFEAIFTLGKLGYKVPEDIAIASADNINSDIMLPLHITSYGADRKQYAKVCFDKLEEKINGTLASNRTGFTKTILDVTLSVGQTT